MVSFTFFLLMAIAGLLILDHWMHQEKHWQRFTAIVLALAVLVGSVTAYTDFAYNFFAKKKVMLEPWNVFHYYLNAKYFKELGYFDAYACAYQADQQGKKMFDNPRVLARDLYTYDELLKQHLPACPEGRFTSERWKAFSDDLAWLQSQEVTLPASYEQDLKLYWNNMLFDKGYNLPPPFVVISQALTKLFPVRQGNVPFILFWIDTIVAVFTIGLVGRWKGWRAAGLFLLSYLFFFGTYRELFGLYLQNIWFFGVTLSLLLWERKNVKASAMALAMAGVMRIFPFFFALGPFVLLIQSILKKDKDQRPVLIKWFVTLCLTTSALLFLGNFTGRGLAVWGEFFHKMSVHSAYIQSEWFDIGWKNALTTFGWINQISLPEWIIPVSTIIFLGVFGWIARRLSFIQSFVLGVIPVYVLVDLSPFYYFILGLPLLFVYDKTTFPWRKIGAGVFIVLALHHLFGWVGPEYTLDLLVQQPLSEMFLIVFYGAWMFFVVRSLQTPQNKDAVEECTGGASS